jgi:hypothetical protein
MEHEPLTEDELGLVCCAIQYPEGFPVKNQYFADAHHLYERGWLDRQLIEDQVVWSLSDRGYTALELGVPVDEAKAAMN